MTIKINHLDVELTEIERKANDVNSAFWELKEKLNGYNLDYWTELALNNLYGEIILLSDMVFDSTE